MIDTSGYVHVETDVYDVHDYDQNPDTFIARYQPLAEGGEARRNFPRDDAPYRPGQPYFVSEYGGIWWNPGQRDSVGWGYGDRPRSEEDFLERYRRLTEYLLQHPKMCGFCYTQLTDVEQEVNGLHTYHREPKFDPSDDPRDQLAARGDRAVGSGTPILDGCEEPLANPFLGKWRGVAPRGAGPIRARAARRLGTGCRR